MKDSSRSHAIFPPKAFPGGDVAMQGVCGLGPQTLVVFLSQRPKPQWQGDMCIKK